MYVIQTQSGRENTVQTYLVSSGILQPSESLWIPMKPKLMHSTSDSGEKVWRQTQDILLPGYLLLDCDDPWDFRSRYMKAGTKMGTMGFHLIGRTQSDGRDKIGADYEADRFTTVSPSELELIRIMCGEVSRGVKVGSRVRIISGPLVGLQGAVVKLNTHHRCALVRLSMFGRSLDIWLSFELLMEEAAGAAE